MEFDLPSEPFAYTIRCLSLELERLEYLDVNHPKIFELKKAIQVFLQGQGYLTKECPIQIKFYKTLLVSENGEKGNG